MLSLGIQHKATTPTQCQTQHYNGQLNNGITQATLSARVLPINNENTYT